VKYICDNKGSALNETPRYILIMVKEILSPEMNKKPQAIDVNLLVT